MGRLNALLGKMPGIFGDRQCTLCIDVLRRHFGDLTMKHAERMAYPSFELVRN